MNVSQIEKNVTEIVNNFNQEEFVYDLLRAYGISKTSISRLKKGDFNLSKVEGEILYKGKMLFKEVPSNKLFDTIDELTKEPDSLKHNPRFVIVTDYITLLAKDIRTKETLDIPILQIHKHFSFFLPWAGQEKYSQTNENYADRKASYKMAKLYDILVTENPDIYDDGGHNLNVFLSRLLFCFFAEDTDIFPIEGMFTNTLQQHTQEDGSDVHIFLDKLFIALDTKDKTDEVSHLKEFPYVNGGLFRDTIALPKFNKEARKIILECGDLDWSEINPDIFGSMIQAVVNPAYRSGLGMHYTSVPNIMKLIEPLFLNELYAEFDRYKENSKKLKQLISRMANLKLFDPACGSGNFLIIAYKELRRLEIKILQQINELERQSSMVFTQLQLTQFYGIEIDDFAHEMAILSLWLAKHQMNKEFLSELQGYGKVNSFLPLNKAGNIVEGNATRLDWEKVCPKNEDDEIYILGNPPYLGSRNQDKEQKEDMKFVFTKGYKSLDYISAWFYKGAKYITGCNAELAFVSTNSICQGEQVVLLWPHLLNEKIEIGFAHQSFKWKNNAKDNAGVTVIIVGLRNKSEKNKYLYVDNLRKKVKNINAYLIEFKDVFVKGTSTSISNFPNITFGSMPNDGGNLLLDKIEKNNLIYEYPNIKKNIYTYLGASDFLNDKKRWCLVIGDDEVDELMNIPDIANRLNKIKNIREKSTEKSTREKAKTPNQFYFFSHRDTDSILIPRVSSERREYIPSGFFNSDTVISDSAMAIYDATPWIFGIISSKMHMVWVRAVGGKLKTDYRYSGKLCYNTFPFPEISLKQKEQINMHVFGILEEREKYPEKTLAQLYDPDKMPKGLKDAHHELDLAIERCYRLRPFESDTERLEYLFKEYEKMVNKNTLLEKPKRKRKK